MNLLLEAIQEAWSLISSGDREIFDITFRTLLFAGTSTIISLIIGLPLGIGLALMHFPGRSWLVSLSNAGTGMPPVVAGLVVSILLWRSGPLGSLGLIYSPLAIIIAQVVIATPLIIAITVAAVMSLNPIIHLQIRAMGANQIQYIFLIAREARLPLLVAVMAGFGAVVSEVGASLMVGGNLSGETRVLTTAAVLEVSKGRFGTALAYGLILIFFVIIIAAILTSLQQRSQRK